MAQRPERKSFADWYFESYREDLGLQKVEGGSRYKAFLAGLDPGTPGQRVFSGVMRMQAFDILKYGYPLDHTGYTCAVFRAQTPEAETHYAYVYWQKGALERPEYICLSPTFDSRDGEYRENFILYDDFEKNYDELLSTFTPAEERLGRMIYEDDLGLHMKVFPTENADEAVRSIDKLRLQMKALVVVWALSYTSIRARHTHVNFVAVMDRLAKALQNAHSKWEKKVPSRLSAFRTGRPNNPYRTKCGQKLTPMTIHEITRPSDVNFYPWREVYVLQICTELVINFICPTYPMHNQWTYIEGAGPLLFENDTMHERYRRSDVARRIVDKLRDARELAQGVGGTPNDYVLGQVDAHIYDSIEYAQSFAVLVETALCTTTERVGLTFNTIPAEIRKADYVSPDFGALFEDPELYAKYLFDLAYGAHVLHTRGGAIHTDLHLNNMTLYEIDTAYKPLAPGTTDPEFTLLYRDPLVAYVGLRGETDTYVFPSRNHTACLIDFSRSILGGVAVESMCADYGVAQTMAFCRDQANRMLRAFHRYAPDLVEKNQEKLKGMILSAPNSAFRALAVVDFLAIGRNLGALLRELQKPREKQPWEKREVHVSKEVVGITARLEKMAQELYLTRLRGLLEEKTPHADDDDSWPGDEILPKVFEAYRFENWPPDRLRKGTLVDAWNYKNRIRYSGRDYERFPPWAKFEEIQRHLGGLKITDVLARGQKPFVDALTAALGQGIETIAEQVRAREKDEPAAATSSWIGE